MERELNRCRSCRALLGSGDEWCGQCFAPVEAPPLDNPAGLAPTAWTGPLARGRPEVDPDPTPPPVYSRWEAGAGTLGPRWKIAITVLFVLPGVVGTALFPGRGILILLDLPVAIGSWVFLRQLWKRDRIS
jgi:hypothetical protein